MITVSVIMTVINSQHCLVQVMCNFNLRIVIAMVIFHDLMQKLYNIHVAAKATIHRDSIMGFPETTFGVDLTPED